MWRAAARVGGWTRAVGDAAARRAGDGWLSAGAAGGDVVGQTRGKVSGAWRRAMATDASAAGPTSMDSAAPAVAAANAAAAPAAPVRPKKRGYDFYRDVLDSPRYVHSLVSASSGHLCQDLTRFMVALQRTCLCTRYVVAPMVDGSELPWRLLSRKYNSQLAYTPMFHAANFALSAKYREKQFTTCPEDRPLLVQFCANDPDTLLKAARIAEPHCDGIDINLGCPQNIARRGARVASMARPV